MTATTTTAPGSMTGTPPAGSEVRWAISDCIVLVGRSLKHITHNLDQLLGVVVMPVMFMILFRYVFGGAIVTAGTSYVNFIVAGILVQQLAFGATTTAMNLAVDLDRGIVDRFRSLPMFSGALLVGHVVADLIRNVVSSAILLAVAFAVGFRPTAGPGEWLLAIGMILLFTQAVSWLSAILGLAVSQEAVQWMTFVTILPLTFASSAFVPTDTMPTALRIFAEQQPFTRVIDAMRGWLVGMPAGNSALIAAIWCVAITAVAMPLTARSFSRLGRRKTR